MKFVIAAVLSGLVVTMAAQSALSFGRGSVSGGVRVGPAGGAGAGVAAHGVSTGPFGGAQAGNVRASTRFGPGGASVQRVDASGVSRGPAGGVKAGSASATRVTGPGGQSYTHSSGAGVKAGPLGAVSAGAGSRSTVRTPYGTGATVGNRVGVATGPYGGVRVGGASGAAVRTPDGGAAVGSRGGAAVGPFGGAAVASRGGVAVGPYGGVRTGHSTKYMSRNTIGSSAVVVRTGYSHSYFTPTWYAARRGAWVAPRYVSGYDYYRPVAWTSAAAFVGITTPPIVCDYGSSVVILDDTVYLNGRQVASAADYAAQADRLANAGRQARPAENDEWQPLGVFGLIQENEKTAQRIFQLAVNKDGIVRGNYYDAVADNTLPVVGSVDKQTQRVAWSIGDKKDIVFETGLSNFTKDDTTVLVHYGKDSTQQMILVRLEEPKDSK